MNQEKSDILLRVSIFIDGSNLYHNLKRHKLKTKFENIISIVSKGRTTSKIFYYTALLDEKVDKVRYLTHRRFLDKLEKIPKFQIIICHLRKIILSDGSMEFLIKGDDIHLASDLIAGAFRNEYDEAVIISGDEDFVPAINIVKQQGKKVINAYF